MSLSILIPACNEADYIDACLTAVLASEGPAVAQVVVVANGCNDDTAARARSYARAFAARGWLIDVLDLPAMGKPGALAAGDAAALYPTRAYLDADVTVSPPLMAQLAETLDTSAARYASGTPNITARSWVTRAYARYWMRLPFVTDGVPGFGLYAVNASGRARWGAFPTIISDDTYVRIVFTPAERIKVPAVYDWPLVEGFCRLVRVRRRQDLGVAELAGMEPGLMVNEGKTKPSFGWLVRSALRDPAAFGVYAIVRLSGRLCPSRQTSWVRGR
ncbi:glycosyltransferase [Pararhodobacter zhoushanensis]|uniref:Glycosyltransferase n=1 Tax=Pararhodobacter zhoushanensis TaxID=2479545 RepID=A0ABT3GUP9_9RHOB|nr:glycosyltransferase [Pararhodobacter zhoushanensis]MCW1931271.1 glycosyltransferase [Pararhodobacter zhoushanensis]